MRNSIQHYILDHPVEVVECDLDITSDILVLKIVGHPTDAVMKAHNLANEILEGRRWRFGTATYTPPEDTDLASGGTFQVDCRIIPKAAG